MLGKKGEIGLVQVMPPTAGHYPRYDPYDVYDNIAIGAVFLKKCLITFSGNRAAAVGAYNCGPNRMRQYIEEGRPLPLSTLNYIVKCGYSIKEIPYVDNGRGPGKKTTESVGTVREHRRDGPEGRHRTNSITSNGKRSKRGKRRNGEKAGIYSGSDVSSTGLVGSLLDDTIVKPSHLASDNLDSSAITSNTPLTTLKPL